MKNSVTRFITVVVLAMLVSACGKRPQIVTGIQVSSSTVSQDVILSLKADLNLGNMTFPAVTLPILHPQGQTPIGSVELVPALGGVNQMKINVNVSSLTDISAVIPQLPNGNSVPLLASNPTIVVDLGAGSKLYLTLSANVVAIGVAVPIKSFDSIGSAVGGVNLFPVFTIDKVVGAAGIFTGSQAGQNGFAIIADVTQYVNMRDIYVPTAAKTTKLNYAEQIPSAAKEDKINSMILKLNNQKKKLELHR